MRPMRHSLVLLALALAASGCVGARGYFGDRWADTKDIFTASVGVGGGAKARVGPLNAGLFANSDVVGLRSGEFFCFPHGPLAGGDWDGVLILLYSYEVFDLRYRGNRVQSFTVPRFDETTGEAMVMRGKDYESTITPPAELELPRTPHYYTQIEVAAGLGGTLRLGFNPGELLDFLLGWTTLDIFQDDLTAQRKQAESRRPREFFLEPLPIKPVPWQPPWQAPYEALGESH